MILVLPSVPLHQVTLNSGLVVGDIIVGTRSQLPVEGVQVILGNDLAGDKVWADGNPVMITRPIAAPGGVPPTMSPDSVGVF